MRDQRKAIPATIIIAIGIIAVSVFVLQQRIRTEIRYFPETRAVVREPFLAFYETHGAVDVFGPPLTDAYTDENGVLSQVFQHAQFQLTVRGVELAPLGEQLNLADGQTDQILDSRFSDFYEQQGGAGLFGQPVSSSRLENEILIQDFERVRLMMTPAGDVQLAPLGEVYLAVFQPITGSGPASIRQGTPPPPLDIRANVSVEHPVVAQEQPQTIYLYVENEDRQAIAGARSLAILHYNGVTAEVELNPTDESGAASATFLAPPALPGSQVIVEMHILVGETLLTIETVYVQWW